MLSYENALKILNQYGNGAAWIQHCLAVADSATIISETLKEKKKHQLNIYLLNILLVRVIYSMGQFKWVSLMK